METKEIKPEQIVIYKGVQRTVYKVYNNKYISLYNEDDGKTEEEFTISINDPNLIV